MGINFGYSLPTVTEPASEIFAALVPATGSGNSIPFLINPSRLSNQVSAKYEEVSLWKGGTYPIWQGQSAERLSVSCTIYQRRSSDIRPVLSALKNAVGQDKLWLFTWGARTLGPLALTEVSIEESSWLGGVPIMATATLSLVRVGVIPTLSSKPSGLTAAEKKAGLTAAAKALGVPESSLTITETGDVKKGGTIVGTYKDGRWVKKTATTTGVVG